jgi:hypothetical protein
MVMSRTGVVVIFCMSLLHLLPRLIDRTYASFNIGSLAHNQRPV